MEGGLFIILALGAFHLLHRDVDHTLLRWVRMTGINPENRYIVHGLAKAGLIDDHRLKQIGAATLAYAALFFAEGFGLLYHKRWAEFLTVIATASFIPLESYEVWRHPTLIKSAVLVGNLAAVIYLLFILRSQSTGASKQRKN